MTLLNLVTSLAGKKPEPFVAPVPAAERVTVHTSQDGIPYRFSVRNPRPGWWELIPDGKLARIDKSAQPTYIIDYLYCLPRFYVIALYAISETSWLVTPYNIADAAQRGWKNGAPREAHLVRMSVEPFDILVVRDMAGSLVFDDVDTRLGESTKARTLQEAVFRNDPMPADANWLNAYRTVLTRTQQLLAEQQRAELNQRILEQKLTTEEAIRFQLEFMGATLRNISTSSRGHQVEWTSPDGHTYTMQVGHNLHINVAGLCLNGTDRQHNLSSIVMVMEEAHRLRRSDIPGYDEEDD